MKIPVSKFIKDIYFIVCVYSSYRYFTIFIYYSILVGIHVSKSFLFELNMALCTATEVMINYVNS